MDEDTFLSSCSEALVPSGCSAKSSLKYFSVGEMEIMVSNDKDINFDFCLSPSCSLRRYVS